MVYLLAIELRREARLWWSYRLDAVLDVILYPVVFTLLIFMFEGVAQESGQSFPKAKEAASVIGILAWYWCMLTMSAIAGTVEKEAETGTLEALLKSPTSALRMFVARTASISFMRGIQTLLMAFIFVVVLGLRLKVSIGTGFVSFLTLAGACGVGLAFAGLAFLNKQVGALASIVGNMSLFFTGALVPINSLEWAFMILRFILPITWGTDLLRKLLINGENISSLSTEIVGLTIQTTCLVVLGMFVFNWGLKKARKAATLQQF